MVVHNHPCGLLCYQITVWLEDGMYTENKKQETKVDFPPELFIELISSCLTEGDSTFYQLESSCEVICGNN